MTWGLWSHLTTSRNSIVPPMTGLCMCRGATRSQPSRRLIARFKSDLILLFVRTLRLQTCTLAITEITWSFGHETENIVSTILQHWLLLANPFPFNREDSLSHPLLLTLFGSAVRSWPFRLAKRLISTRRLPVTKSIRYSWRIIWMSSAIWREVSGSSRGGETTK